MATMIGYNGYWNVKCEVYEKANSVNVANNTSVVRVDVYVGRNSGTGNNYYIWGDFNGSITVDGQTQSFSGNTRGQQYINAGNYWNTSISKEFTIGHNNDGSKSVGASFSWSAEFSPNSASGSTSLGLTTIPRATDCPSFTGFIKSGYTINISPKSGNFSHSIEFIMGNDHKWLHGDGTISSNSERLYGNSFGVTIPASYYSIIGGGSSYGRGTIKLYTYNGNTHIGTKENTLIIQCNPAFKPEITSYSIVDINNTTLNITNNENDIIQNASTARVNMVLTAGDSDDPLATITTRTINNVPFSGSQIDITDTVTNSFVVNLANNRGANNTITIQASGRLLPYIKPTFNLVSLKRPEPTGSKVDIEYNGNVFAGVFDRKIDNDNFIVGQQMNYNNAAFNIPNDIYESMSKMPYTKDVIVGSSHKLVEEVGSATGKYYYLLYYADLDDSETDFNFDIYRAEVTKIDSSVTVYNQPDLVMTNANIGTIQSIDTTSVFYQYIKNTDSDIVQPIPNTFTIDWYYKEKGTNTWITGGTLSPTLDTQNNTYSGQGTLANIFNYQKQYDFKFTISDLINTLTLEQSVTRGLPVFWWDSQNLYVNGDILSNGQSVLTRDIMSVTLSSNVSRTTSNNYEETKIPIDTVSMTSGNHLIFDDNNNAIVIGTNVSKVLISGAVSFVYTNNVIVGASIKHNNGNEGVMRSLLHTSTNYNTTTTSPYVLDVTPGDVITLCAYIDTPTTVEIRSKYTLLTVEVIEYTF